MANYIVSVTTSDDSIIRIFSDSVYLGYKYVNQGLNNLIFELSELKDITYIIEDFKGKVLSITTVTPELTISSTNLITNKYDNLPIKRSIWANHLTDDRNNIVVQDYAFKKAITPDLGKYSWGDVAFGNGVFVAVSNSGASTQSATSVDGKNWTIRSNLPSAGAWSVVVYGNGIFAAFISSSTKAAISADNGVTWTSKTLPISAIWTDAVYGNNAFVVLPLSSANTVVSTDNGDTWVQGNIGVSSSWKSIAYGNNMFLTVSSNTLSSVYSSIDGINWTARTMPMTSGWYHTSFMDGKFVAISTSHYYFESANCIDWGNMEIPNIIPTAIASLYYKLNDFYIIVLGGGSYIFVSYDNNVWFSRNMDGNPFGIAKRIIYGNDVVVMATPGAIFFSDLTAKEIIYLFN
jgi:hypothetical protein